MVVRLIQRETGMYIVHYVAVYYIRSNNWEREQSCSHGKSIFLSFFGMCRWHCVHVYVNYKVT